MADKRFNQITRVVTSFDSNDVLPIGNGTLGDGKMTGDQLLKVTAQNALAGNVALAFDPTRTSDNPYLVNQFVSYEGKTYIFIRNHYGAWSVSDVRQVPFDMPVRDAINMVNLLKDKNFLKSSLQPTNLIKRDFLIKGEYINTDGRALLSNDWCRTDFIEIEASTNYIGTGVGLSAFYDADYNFISYVSAFTYATVSPATAKYVRCSILPANSANCGLAKGSALPSDFDDGFVSFDKEFVLNLGRRLGVFLWPSTPISVDAGSYMIAFPARCVFQSYVTGKYCLINASEVKVYTLDDAKSLVLNCDFSTDTTFASYDDAIFEVTTNTAKEKVVLYNRVDDFIFSQVDNISINAIGCSPSFKNRGIFVWHDVSVDVANYTVTFPARCVFQSFLTGKYCLINAPAPKTYSLSDARRLVLRCDFIRDTTFASYDDAISEITVSGKADKITIVARAAGKLHSDVSAIQNKIDLSAYQAKEMPQPPVITEKFSDLASSVFDLLKSKTQDVNIVMLGDSLSTALGYEATDRPDAKFRPPLMTEYTYPSYIEEQLRWDGQVYNRFDVDGVFTETCTSAENLEQDTEHWDWSSNNNRPALTRCLSGTDCSVSFEFDPDYVRTDYIYRTDCTNPASAEVTISSGDNNVLVYNETTNSWVEANRFTFSAQESSTPISTAFGPLMKSMYQKRLKFKWTSTAVQNCSITITNNGAGRLTYWGLQKSKRLTMLNFINASRGGHSCERIANFEEWDVDYWQPQLILWEPPYFNHSGVDICDGDYDPLTNRQGVTAFVDRFEDYVDNLLAKSYSPKIISWSMWVASQATIHSIDQDGNWLFGTTSGGDYVSTPMYLCGLYAMLKTKNIKYIDFCSLFRKYGFEYMQYRSMNQFENATTIASGKTGLTWTFDGGHLNDLGHKILSQMFGSFFLQ